MRKHSVSWCQFPVNIPGISYRRYNTETAFQAYCAHWLRQQFSLTHHPIYAHWHHSANERSNPSEGFNAKMMGQAKGFPDFIQIAYKIAVEFKLPGKEPSAHQVYWLNYLKSAGYHAEVISNFERFRDLVLSRV